MGNMSWKNLDVTPLNTHLWCFQGHRWENVHFLTKPRHVTPQMIVSEKQALF